MAAIAMPYNANYGNPWGMNSLGQNQNQNVPQNNTQNPLIYGNQIPQQNYGSLMTVFVQGEAGANAYPVASGNTVMLMDFESGKFWIKSNVNGIPQRLRSFSFSEEIQGQTQAQSTNAVSREEFNKLAENVNKLLAELGGVPSE